VSQPPRLRFEYKLLFLKALTPLHVGAGRGASIYVDMPLQRDEFGFPTIWASSLKGALRANFAGKFKNIIFGPEPGGASDYSSAVSFSDARIILVPSRTLKGIWAYMTSPHMMEQLNTFLGIAGKEGVSVPSVDDGKAIVSSGNLIIDSRVVVNESSLEAKVDASVVDSLAKALPPELGNSVRSRGLIVVADDIARTMVNRSIVVQYRVRLKETKTVEQGPWSEEYLPAETVMVSLIVCKEFKASKELAQKLMLESEQVGADRVCGELENGYKNSKYNIYVGGKETIGKGLIRLYFT